ncbi:hypothetical protein EIP86_003200 [Pleurotus ostreatoroseus]|nr:hypothetical protein EIP86_003200 [Pleurotus ostreatoroseus]
MAQADAILSGLQSGRMHLATEATVVACSILTSDPADYTARPFMISGTCKHETVKQHTDLLDTCVETLRASPDIPDRLRLYVVTSDGDSRRRRALIAITMKAPLSAASPIYSLLTPLKLFNTMCGKDDLTNDCDYLHGGKRCRNTVIRPKGMRIDGILVTASMIKSHLVEHGMSTLTADTLLSPNDKQDVVLMIQLLNAISELPSCSVNASPTYQGTRRVLRLLGILWHAILSTYLDIQLSLHEQLVNLSTAAHLLLTLYAREKGDFIPVQLYFDLMSMIKSAYFCVAKAKIDNPNGQFWLILLGTDSLEHTFGKIRTMIGSDTNVDQLQLADRIDAAVTCVRILEAHPEWGGTARRLKIKPLKGQGSDISKSMDHITPKVWKGDVYVRSVVLLTSWQEGRRQAEAALEKAAISAPFDDMDQAGGYDIFCPFGSNRMILINGRIDNCERDEDEDERDYCTAVVSDTISPKDQAPVPSDEASVLDLDTLAANALVKPSSDDCISQSKDDSDSHHAAFVQIDESATMKHKATVMRLYTNFLGMPTNSKDRLKRVRGFTQYDEAYSGQRSVAFEEGSASEAVLAVEDPAVTLVQCDGLIFVAVVEVVGICKNSMQVSTIPITHLHEPNIQVRGHIMTLTSLSEVHQPVEPDWEWDGTFIEGADLRDIDGICIEAINPLTASGTSARVKDIQTFVFRTSELQGIGALLYSKLQSELHRVQTVSSTIQFPYRTLDGMFSVHLGEPYLIYKLQDKLALCAKMSLVIVQRTKGGVYYVLGAHILHDTKMRDADNPCGFCLRTGGSCVIYLEKKSAGSLRIDKKLSQCPNLRTLSLKVAAEYTPKSPCTNLPLACPLCPKSATAVWKYNLRAHIRSKHPSANCELPEYRQLYNIGADERTLLKAVLLKPTRKPRKKSKRHAGILKVSDLHSTSSAFKALLGTEKDGLDEANGEATVSEDIASNDGGLDEHSDNTDEEDDISEFEELDPLQLKKAQSTTHIEDNEVDSPGVEQTVTNIPQEPITSSFQSPMPNRSSRHKKRKSEDMETICSECYGALLESDTILRCMGPACEETYHLACQGMLTQPTKDWFCDEFCRENATGKTVGGRKRVKRRRIA